MVERAAREGRPRVRAEALKGVLLALLLALSGAALAQDGSANKAGASATPAASDDWQAVDGRMGVREGESFQATHLVAAAYAFIWFAVAGFVFTVWRRNQALERDLASLRGEIDARAKRR